MVQEIDKGVKGAKKYKNILKYIIVFVSIIALAFIIYFAMYFHFKKTVIDKFNDVALKYNFKKENGEMYMLNYKNNTMYSIMNPFPSLFDFKLGYEDKTLDCTIITGEYLKNNNGDGTGWSSEVQIHWTNDGIISMDSYACEDKSNFSTSLKDSKGNECDYYSKIAHFEINNDDNVVININFDEVSDKLNVNKEILSEAVIQGTNIYKDLYGR